MRIANTNWAALTVHDAEFSGPAMRIRALPGPVPGDAKWLSLLEDFTDKIQVEFRIEGVPHRAIFYSGDLLELNLRIKDLEEFGIQTRIFTEQETLPVSTLTSPVPINVPRGPTYLVVDCTLPGAPWSAREKIAVRDCARELEAYSRSLQESPGIVSLDDERRKRLEALNPEWASGPIYEEPAPTPSRKSNTTELTVQDIKDLVVHNRLENCAVLLRNATESTVETWQFESRFTHEGEKPFQVIIYRETGSVWIYWDHLERTKRLFQIT